MFGIHEQVMHSDGQGIKNEENKGQTPHRIAVKISAGSFGSHGVEGDIGGNSQKYTIACSVHEKRVLLSPGSIVLDQPSAAGMT